MIDIYAISGPTRMEYVGQTSIGIERRFRQHASSKRPDMLLAVAMSEMGAELFTLRLLQTCGSQAEANRAEREWILLLGCLSPDGYNTNVGVGRHALTAERISAALRGRTISWASKISETMRGHSSTERQREALAAGRERWRTDPEFADRRSAENPRRKATDEMVQEIRAACAGGESQQAVADRLGLSQSTVSKIVRGVRFADLLPDED